MLLEEKKAIEMIEIIVAECKLENKRKGYEGTYYDDDTPIPYKEYEILLNFITKLQKENERNKKLLANNLASNLNESIKAKNKAENDLEDLNEGWKIEIEKKDKIIILMARWIFNKDYTENSLLIHRDNCYSNCIKQVIKCFEKKSEQF